MGSDDTEQDATHNDIERPKMVCPEVFDSDDLLKHDNCLAIVWQFFVYINNLTRWTRPGILAVHRNRVRTVLRLFI